MAQLKIKAAYNVADGLLELKVDMREAVLILRCLEKAGANFDIDSVGVDAAMKSFLVESLESR